jgi:hypothetical protein
VTRTPRRERSSRIAVGRLLADLALVVAAMVLAAPTLFYPLGNDQGLYSYAGAAWLHGQLPYRDFVDLKPPGIYLAHALIAGVLGWNAWAIRAVEVVLVMAIGVASVLSLPRRTAPKPFELGAVVLVVTTFYYFTFDFWGTAQAELWEAAAVVVAYGLLARGGRRPWFQAGAGITLGIGCLFKPTVLVAAVPLLVLPLLPALPSFVDGGRARSLAAARIVAGMLAPSLVVVAYFGLHRDGLASVHEVLFGLLSHYVHHSNRTAEDFGAKLVRFATTQSQPVLGLVLVGWAWALVRLWRRRDSAAVRAAIVPALLLGSAIGSVLVQGRLFWYHWGVLVAPVALLAAVAVAELATIQPGFAALAGLSCCFGSWWVAPESTMMPGYTYPMHVRRIVAHLRGEIDRQRYLAPFHNEAFGYSSWDEEQIGVTIRAMASPGDRLQVFGTTTSIYVEAGLLAPTRFPATHFLTHPLLSYRRQAWWAQFDHQFFPAPPRFAVTSVQTPVVIRRLLRAGYGPRLQSGDLLLLERRNPGGTSSIPERSESRTTGAVAWPQGQDG